MKANNTNIGKPNMKDVIEPFFRFWKRAMVLFVVITLTALAVLAFTPSEYTSTAKLIMRRSRDLVFLNPLTTDHETRSVHKTWTSEIKSELELLSNHEMIQAVIQDLGADAFLDIPEPKRTGKLGFIRIALNPVRRALENTVNRIGAENEDEGAIEKEDKAIEMAEENLSIYDREDSDIIIVSYTAYDPAFAREVVGRIIEIYLDKRIPILQVPGTQQFFRQQTEELLNELNATENSILAIKSEAGISTLADKRQALQQTIGEVRTRKLNTESSLAAANARLAHLQDLLKHTEYAATLEPDPFPTEDASSNVNLNVLLGKMALSDSPVGNPMPAGSNQGGTNQSPKESTRVLLTPEEFQTLLATLHEEESMQSALSAEQLKIEQQLQDLQNELNAINQLEIPLRTLERKRSQLEAKYHKFSENLELARINQALEQKRISNVSIVQHATLPVKPDSSGKLLKLLMAMFVGMCSSVGLVYAAEALDPTLRTARDLAERLDAYPLAVLPRMHRKDKVLTRKAPLGSKKSLLPVRLRTNSTKGIEEGIQDLSLQLIASRSKDMSGRFVIGITGSQPGEGVSMVAALLCQAFASDGRFSKVLLLDAHPDTHKSSLYKQMLHAPFAYRCITEKIVDTQEDTPNSSTLLSESLAYIRGQEFDIIVVDMPAVAQGSFPLRVAAEMDGVLFVIDAGHLPWRDARRALELLKNSNAQLYGTVLNRKRQVIPNWLDSRL